MQAPQSELNSNDATYQSSSCSSTQVANKTMMTNTVIVFDFDDTLFPTHKLKEIQARSTNSNSKSSTNHINLAIFKSQND